MRRRSFLPWLPAAALSGLPAAGVLAQQQPADRMSVVRSGNVFMITRPSSRLTLSIPAKGLHQERRGLSAKRQFIFEDYNGTRISGRFEPASRFPGLEWAWQSEQIEHVNAPPTEVSFGRLSGWETVSYRPETAAVSRLSIQAHQVRADTWIEVNIAVIRSRGNADPDAMALLDALQVADKP